MRSLRLIHACLGCVFAPILIYFAVSGAVQTAGYHRFMKSGEERMIRSVGNALAAPHMYQGIRPKVDRSPGFGWFAILACLGLVANSVLGIVMAFKFVRPTWLVGACLISGTILPSGFLLWAFLT